MREGIICCWVLAALILILCDIFDVLPLFTDGKDADAGGVILIIITCLFCCGTLGYFTLYDANSALPVPWQENSPHSRARADSD